MSQWNRSSISQHESSQTQIQVSEGENDAKFTVPYSNSQSFGVLESDLAPYGLSKKALAKYHRLEKIGEGTYGVVYKAQHIVTRTPVALKIIRLDSAEEGAPSTAVREITLLKQLVHPNIVTLYEVVHSQSSITMVFEFLDQDLKALLDAVGPVPLDPYVVMSYMYQLLLAIDHCHRSHVLHRDLKPQNILLTNSGVLKLADFGLARGTSIPVAKLTNEVVTLWYRPPDILLGASKYTTAVDMWGVGCIFAEMASGRPLFSGASDADQLHRIAAVIGTPPENEWPDFYKRPNAPQPNQTGIPLSRLIPLLPPEGIDLLTRMLKLNPKHRITAHEALSHGYFRELREAAVAASAIRDAYIQRNALLASMPPAVAAKAWAEAQMLPEDDVNVSTVSIASIVTTNGEGGAPSNSMVITSSSSSSSSPSPSSSPTYTSPSPSSSPPSSSSSSSSMTVTLSTSPPLSTSSSLLTSATSPMGMTTSSNYPR